MNYYDYKNAKRAGEKTAMDQDTAVGDAFVEAAVLISRAVSAVNRLIKTGDQASIDLQNVKDAELAMAFVNGMDHGLAIDNEMDKEYLLYMQKAIASLQTSRSNGFQTEVYEPPNPFELLNISHEDFVGDRRNFLHCFNIVTPRKEVLENQQKKTDNVKEGIPPYCRDYGTNEPTNVGISSESNPGLNDNTPCEDEPLR